MLNRDFMNFADDHCCDVRKCWADYVLVQHIAGLLYSMEDDHQARDPQKIINEFLSKFIQLDGISVVGTTALYIATLDELMDKLREILLSIPEFVKLNDDKENGEFIDLDAFLRNLKYDLKIGLMIDLLYSCTKFDVTLS